MSSNNRFLEHLQNVIPKNARNYMLSTYSIILEAWRRGLDINIRIVLEASGSIEPYYSISNGEKTHHFSATRGDLVSREAIDLTKNKQLAKEYLIKNNVPTPIGKSFNKEVPNTEIIQYAEEINYPVVVKPLKGTGGKGVIANISNKEELQEALEYVRVKLNYPDVILERYFKGHDYRLYVINGEVVGAIKRIKANVVGNGKSTIKQLIDEKNKQRQKLPALSNRPIQVNQETKMLLKHNGYDLTSVPTEGEIVYLKTKNNVSAGGDSIDVTDQVSDNIKQIAIDAINSFPSLPQGGIDVMVNEDDDTGVVIELNSRAHITQHLFPMKGQARDIPSKIIDFYFPETKNYNREEASKLYIDYDYIYNSCLSRTAKVINIPKIAASPIILRRYLLENCDYTNQLATRIRRVAFNNKVNGYIKPLKNGDVVVVVGGHSNRVDKFKKELHRRLGKISTEIKITEKARTTPIKHGFHIEGFNETELSTGPNSLNNPDIYIHKYSHLKRDYQRLVRKLADYEQKESIVAATKKQNIQLKKQLKQLTSSTSWKITEPIRKLGKLFNK